MSVPKQMHVAANFPQDFTEEEKAQARENIGAINRQYFGSDTIDVDSDGVITGKYRGGYGIEIEGNVIKKTHHRLMATNNIQYTYCKVFDFSWQYVYGRGQCCFTATQYGGSYVTFTVSLTRALGADYTVAWPYVVSASDDMADPSAFVEKLEIRSVGNRIVGYLKLHNFAQDQFWLDWEGSSGAGIVSFTPQLTNSPEGNIEWTRTIDKYDVWYSQADADSIFQKRLTAGRHIYLDSDNVISGDGVLIAQYGLTPFNAIKDAISKGDYVVAKSGTMYYTLQHDFAELVVFMGKNNLMHSEASFVQVDSDNVWSSINSIPAITSFTEHGSTTPSESWYEIDHTSSFVFAQKGSNGGNMQLGVKLGAQGWHGSYKVFTRLYHNSTQSSAPPNGTTSFSTVTIGANDFVEFGTVPQYMLQTGTQWTYIVELAYSANPGRSVRFTVSGISSTDITYIAEEIR